MHLKSAALALYFSSFIFAPPAFSQTRIVVSGAALQAQINGSGGEAAESSGSATPGDSAEEEEKTSPEDDLVTKLVEIKFERTPSTILKAWSEEHRKKEDDDREEKDKADKSVTRDATVASQFGEVLVLKLGEVKDSASLKLKEDVVVLVAAKDDEAIKTKATVVSIDDENLVLKITPEKTESEKPSGDSKKEGKDGDGEKAEVKQKVSPVEFSSDDLVAVSLDSKEDDKAKRDQAAAVKKQVETFTRDVVLAKWDEIKTSLDAMKTANAEKVYTHLLTSLAASEMKFPKGLSEQMIQQLKQMNRRETPPQSFLTPEDILQLTEISPRAIEIVIKADEEDEDESESEAKGESKKEANSKDSKTASASSEEKVVKEGEEEQGEEQDAAVDHLPAIATLFSIAKRNGHSFAAVVSKMKEGTRHFGLDDRVKRLTAAQLLLQSQMIDEAESFLPDWEAEPTKSDVPALKLWSQIALSRHQEKGVAIWLEKAWKINQFIVAVKKLDEEDRELAISNLITLSSKVDKEVGQKWLDESFTEAPERGMEILKNLGSQSASYATQADSYDENTRFKLLTLQNEAVERLIELSPGELQSWSPALTLLASNWLTEAQTTLKHSTEGGGNSYMSVDMYGNYYWVDENQYNQRWGGRAQPTPISINHILQITPGKEWQTHISESLTSKMKLSTAELKIRGKREDEAFPEIEAIAVDDPEQGEQLIEKFLRSWISSHDPNTEKRRRNPYIYYYGFDQKADAIPLTRSKQERNLEDLAGWVQRIRKLDGIDVDEELLSEAFTTCHSSAEVFQFDAVKKVFGNLEDLKPETIATLCNRMRTGLSEQWRSVKLQEEKQTKRKLPEIQREVVEGYETGLKLADDALVGSPDSWELNLAKACLMYEQNAYSQSIEKRSDFSDRRDAAFAQFKMAADYYAAAARTLEKKDQSTDVYDYWFYAALGACDLGKVSSKTVPDHRQYAEIRKAMDLLGGVLAEDHISKVANNLFTRMSPIKPEIKFGYLRGGFEIIGDHPRATEAKALYDYYKDLVSEIKLEVAVDGSADVGHGEPFGAYVNLLHTEEIERESGGFAKYVQNQNSGWYSYNYGRPTENYRDKFNEMIDIALEKHFEVISVTFISPDEMDSRPLEAEGWRTTPFAYVLLKAVGAEVDRIAPLRIDMDFLDTSGYVVIPVESPAVVVDASSETVTDRPVSDLVITQTLDERMAQEGKIVVEVSATAKGLVPPLDQILKLDQENFEVVDIEDQGVLASKFDEESNTPQILSERSWSVEYRGVEGKGESADFDFGMPVMADIISNYQRYQDADLVDVEPTVSLDRKYGSSAGWSYWWVLPLLAIIAVSTVFFWRGKPVEQSQARFEVPQEINPFTVLTVLRDIKQRNGITDQQSEALNHSINRVESFYFGRSQQDLAAEDLKALAEQWVRESN